MDADATVAERAQNVILNQPLDPFISALTRADADPRIFSYCADNLCRKPGIADALAKNHACPASIVAHVVPQLTSAGIQAVLDNLDRLSSDQHLIAALAQCQAATPEQQELIAGLHKNDVLPVEFIEETAIEAEPDAAKRQTLTQELASMNVVQRLMLALKVGRQARMMLIRDPNKLVQRCVLQSPRLTDTEVELFAAMTNVSQEVLRNISLSRHFMKNYSIVRNLMTNPKTPLDITLHLLPRLTATDLAKLTTNKNIADTLRSTAQKLHRKRKMGDKSD
jgi:hypothetical protein